LICDVGGGGRAKAGRFRLEVRHRPQSNRKLRTCTFYDLPPLELMQDEPRVEAFAKWTELVSNRQEQSGANGKC
jgi:hypothetical protein